MPDHDEIYARHADCYERLVSREDYQHNILPALQQIRPLAGLDVAELGAGTGRLSRLLAPVVRSLWLLDASQHMLDVAQTKLDRCGLHNWRAQVADHRSLPVDESSADLVIAGWSVCYLVTWEGEGWQEALRAALGEMRRVLRPGGTIVLLETLGTGYDAPHPPDALVDYYSYLETAGFASTWIRTDYRFRSLLEAEELVRFFFGQELAALVVQRNWVILPECTGLWWQHI